MGDLEFTLFDSRCALVSMITPVGPLQRTCGSSQQLMGVDDEHVPPYFKPEQVMMGQPANEAFFCYYGQSKKLFSDSITCTLMMCTHVIAAAGTELRFFLFISSLYRLLVTFPVWSWKEAQTQASSLTTTQHQTSKHMSWKIKFTALLIIVYLSFPIAPVLSLSLVGHLSGLPLSLSVSPIFLVSCLLKQKISISCQSDSLC